MVENLKRVREPVTWLVLLVIVATMVLSVVRLVIAVTQDHMTVFAGFQDIATSAMSLVVVVVLVLMVCLCLFVTPVTKRAVPVAHAAAIVVTLGTVLTVLATVMGVIASPGVLNLILELLGGLLDILLKIVACVVLWLIYRAARGGRLEAAEAAAHQDAVTATTEDAPVWQPGTASGSVWKTAADAANGSVWGSAAAVAGQDVQKPAAEAPQPAVPAPREGAAEAFGWKPVRHEDPAEHDQA